MHGRQSEEQQRQRHMLPVPSNGTVGDSSSIKFFSKDGRKISIGDCALFQAGNAPPFIGIIRCLTSDKEGHVKLSVNWLYRPADVKLGKGVLLEAAPNEVFYSFHKDEISAASLLHPCKVAFLRKGVELPSGISSFVCRRVYDTTNRCLWWLTDQDYTDEHQEEVNKLLDKTRQEMHAAVQSGGPSPKDLNGPASTLKTSSDSTQNTSFPSQVKGKKRERADQNTDPLKRERFSKSDGSDTGHFKQECIMRPEEIARITNKDGSLINSEAVGQLVHLMQLDRSDDGKKGIDLALWRTSLVSVIATTDRDDCLSQFVQLRGLPILDDWLQEAHKGKTGDAGSPKEGDKVVEELLLVLLRALDRLPVDLDALKTCNVGKSVNHLKNHKNQEIQRKARILVDTWKKRVDAEMKNNDTKSGSSQGASLPCKQATGEVAYTHGGKRAGSAEAVKNSTPLNSTVKTVSNKSGQTDIISRSTSVPSGSGKVSTLLSSTISTKDSHCKVTMSSGTNEFPVTSIKEEKSSSSSQSQNNSQSWSSEPGKAAGSVWKEDARSSTAGSMSAKGSSSGSRHRKSSNGVLGSGKSGCQKEASGGKLIWSKSTCEKSSQSGHTSDKAIDNSRGDNTNSHRLIVKLPNPGRTPAPSPSSGTVEDMVIPASRGSSPNISDKHDASDARPKAKIDVCHANSVLEVNTESWQSNEVKDGFTEGDDGERSSAAIPSEERSRIGEEIEKTSEISKMAPSSESGKANDPSKGLIEVENVKTSERVGIATVSKNSCSQLSSATVGDMEDGGMNSLANLAANETSKDRKMTVVGASERCSSAAGEGSLDESTIRCAVDKVLSNPTDDADDRSTICIKEVKDLTVARENPDVCSNDLLNKIQKIGRSLAADPSKCLEHPSSEDSEDLNSSLDGTGKGPVCPRTPSEQKTAGKRKGLPSNQGVEHCTENSSDPVRKLGEVVKEMVSDAPTEMACVSGKSTEDGLNAFKMSKDDDEEQVQTHVKTCTFEDGKLAGDIGMDKDIKDNSADDQLIVVENCAGAKTPDKTLEVASTVWTEVEQEVVGDGKSVLSTTSFNDALHESAAYNLRNDQERDGDLPDDKQLQNSVKEVEDRKEDVVVDNNHLLSTRSIGHLDGSQKSVTEKREDMEGEETTGASDGEEINQISQVNVCIDKKMADIQTGPDSRKCESDRWDCKEECLPFRHPADPVISDAEAEAKQISDSTIHNGQAGIVDAADDKTIIEMQMTTTAVVGTTDTSVKLDFDLNEGFSMEDTNQDDAAASAISMLTSSASDTLISKSGGLATPIAVAAKAKGTFIPPASPLRSTGELGWKGSAATSAFRPAEPRRTPERQHVTSEGPHLDATTSVTAGVSGIQSRPHLDIDLNVPDEGVVEDGLMTCFSSQISARVTSSELATVSGHNFVLSSRELSAAGGSASAGKLDLDLNRVEECEDTGPVPRHTEALGASLNIFANGFSNGESQGPRGFDLNDGPSLEDAVVEPGPWNSNAKTKGNSGPPLSGWRMNGEVVNLTSCLPPGNSHPGLAIHSYPSDGTERSYPVLTSASGPTYNCDPYRGSVITSAPAIAYPNATQPTFPYGGFSFGSNFSMTSTSFSGGPTLYGDSLGTPCFSAVPSQLVTAGAVSAPGARPYVMGLTDVSGMEGPRKWPRPILDLNAGPGTVDLEVRDSKQFAIVDSRVSTESHTRSFNQTTASTVMPLKRKEPEGGWDSHSVGYIQSPWQ